MKLLVAAFLILTGASHSALAKGVSAEIIGEQKCAESLYVELSTYMSSTLRACSYGRTDILFQKCTTQVAGIFGNDNVEVAGQACSLLDSVPAAACASELYLRGGLYVSNRSQAADGVRICSLPNHDSLKKCIIEKYQSRQASGPQAAQQCLGVQNPPARASETRQQAECRKNEGARPQAVSQSQSQPQIQPQKKSEPVKSKDDPILDLPTLE